MNDRRIINTELVTDTDLYFRGMSLYKHILDEAHEVYKDEPCTITVTPWVYDALIYYLTEGEVTSGFHEIRLLGYIKVISAART